LEHQITTILTQSEFQAMLNDSFHSLDLNRQIEHAELSIEDLNNKIEETRQELANENVKLTNMETSEDYSKTVHRFQMEREQLQKWAYEWSVLKTAKDTLVETKRIYRDKYLYKVIDKTSSYFSVLTGGNYRRIFAPSK